MVLVRQVNGFKKKNNTTFWGETVKFGQGIMGAF
jgi:hypothetical protein